MTELETPSPPRCKAYFAAYRRVAHDDHSIELEYVCDLRLGHPGYKHFDEESNTEWFVSCA